MLNYKAVLFYFQILQAVKQTSRFLPSVTIQIQDSGCLMILTTGSVILATPELMFSSVMQESAKVSRRESWHSVQGKLDTWVLPTFAVTTLAQEMIPGIFLGLYLVNFVIVMVSTVTLWEGRVVLE